MKWRDLGKWGIEEGKKTSGILFKQLKTLITKKTLGRALQIQWILPLSLFVLVKKKQER